LFLKKPFLQEFIDFQDFLGPASIFQDFPGKCPNKISGVSRISRTRYEPWWEDFKFCKGTSLHKKFACISRKATF